MWRLGHVRGFENKSKQAKDPQSTLDYRTISTWRFTVCTQVTQGDCLVLNNDVKVEICYSISSLLHKKNEVSFQEAQSNKAHRSSSSWYNDISEKGPIAVTNLDAGVQRGFQLRQREMSAYEWKWIESRRVYVNKEKSYHWNVHDDELMKWRNTAI